MLKKTLKIIAFLICAAVIFSVAVRILRFKSPDGIDQMHAFYENEENTVDALFLGSSHMYTNVNTGILWSDYGIAAYDLGGADQPFWNTYYFMKEALKTQRPKVIVVEIYSAAVQEGHFQGVWVIENLFGMRFTDDFILSAKESVEEDWHGEYINRFARYHSRYSMITKDDFVYDDEMRYFKGFDPKFGTVVYDAPNVSHVTELSYPNEKMADYMIQMIDLAKEEDIPIVLVCAPYIISEEDQKVFNVFYQYAEENGVPYIDFNKMYEELGMDFSQDMKDWSHLNEKGNPKYTRYLGEYLKANYEIPDRRGDEKYVSWDINAALLEHEAAAYDMQETTDLAAYLELAAQEDYIVMMAARNISEDQMPVFSEDVLQRLAALGMEQDMLTQDGNIVLRDGVAEYSHTGMNFEWYTEDGNSDFRIARKYIEGLLDEFGEQLHDVSMMTVDGQEYFQEECALNIVVYDRVLGRVVDAVGVKAEDGTPMTRLSEDDSDI